LKAAILVIALSPVKLFTRRPGKRLFDATEIREGKLYLCGALVARAAFSRKLRPTRSV
jgi:hypothetical protein